MEPKYYLIAGRKFILNTDLTLKQLVEIEKLLKDTSFGANTIEIKASMESIKKLLGILLTSIEAEQYPIDFGDVTEKIYVEVIVDFFDYRLKSMADMQESLKKLTDLQNALSPSIGN